MNPTIIAVAGVTALAIVVLAIGVAMSGRSGISDRLERYAASKPQPDGKPAGTGQGGVAELFAQSQALASLNRAVEGRDFWTNTARDIARADLHLRPTEFLTIWAGSTVGVPLIMLAMSLFLPALRSPLVLLIGVVIGFLLPRFWLARRRNGRLGAFNKQLPDTITLIAHALRQAGYTVLLASDGQTALEIARDHSAPIHLLLTDVAMPGMNGRVLSEHLTAVRPETRVLFMSGYPDDAVLQHGIETSSAHFIQKPFSMDALLAKIRKTLQPSADSPRPADARV